MGSDTFCATTIVVQNVMVAHAHAITSGLGRFQSRD
jgi:hypothetical protein